MIHKRTPIGKFIHSSWGNLNIRAGKYRHLQTKNKCKTYENINIEFSRKEYKEWCLKHKEHILSLKRPSLDRINSNLNYTLNNIRIIELSENIRGKRSGTAYLNGPKSKELRGVKKAGKKFSSRITIKGKENYIGVFETKEEAYEAFKNEYIKYYGKAPW